MDEILQLVLHRRDAQGRVDAAKAERKQVEDQLAAKMEPGKLYSEDPSPRPVLVCVNGQFAEMVPISLAPPAQ